MQITIEHHDLEITDALRNYAEEKVTLLEKYADIIKADVELGREGHHQKGEIYICEVHVFVAGKDFFVKREEEDIYKAIDKVKDHLKNELTTWKDKQVSERRAEGEAVESETQEEV